MQEPVCRDLEAPVTRATVQSPMCAFHGADPVRRRRLRAAERRELVGAKQSLGRLVHPVKVRWMLESDPVCTVYRSRCRRDVVMVGTAVSVEAGVEGLWRFLHIEGDDAVGKEAVKTASKAVRVGTLGHVSVGDLASRVDALVCPARGHQSNGLAESSRERVFHGALDGDPGGLPLPPHEVSAVIFEEKAEARQGGRRRMESRSSLRVQSRAQSGAIFPFR